eukprot:353600-Chlamydomonas_euryale.AAC.14
MATEVALVDSDVGDAPVERITSSVVSRSSKWSAIALEGPKARNSQAEPPVHGHAGRQCHGFPHRGFT